MTIKPLFAAIALATAAVSGAASANVGGTAAVRYGDLDLQSHDGRRAFDNRLAQAITDVCGIPDASSRFAVANCRTSAYRDAREQLGKVGAR